MYKFTSGIIVYDKKTRDNFLRAGHKLVEEKADNGENNVSTISKELRRDNSKVEEYRKQNDRKFQASNK